MYFNEEETLNESTDKNKKFLTNHMGIDFTGKIEKVKSFYDIPYNFYKGFSTMSEVTSYLKRFGPMYFFELGDYEYLYQDRGNKDWFIDEYGHVYDKDEFLERLGLDVLGLRFSDIIRMYFNEEEEDMITENKQNNPIDRILKSHKITYDINYKKRSYFRGDQLDSVDITFYIDRGNGRKPEAMQTVYFKTRGNKIIPHTEPIIYGDFHWMFDVFEFIPTKLLTPYFTEKAKSYIEEYLPIEYPFG
jgi:hypothetical protein